MIIIAIDNIYNLCYNTGVRIKILDGGKKMLYFLIGFVLIGIAGIFFSGGLFYGITYIPKDPENFRAEKIKIIRDFIGISMFIIILGVFGIFIYYFK